MVLAPDAERGVPATLLRDRPVPECGEAGILQCLEADDGDRGRERDCERNDDLRVSPRGRRQATSAGNPETIWTLPRPSPGVARGGVGSGIRCSVGGEEGP